MVDSILERRVERLELETRRARRRVWVAFIAGALLVVAPAAALASHQFTDVPSGYLFHNDIDRVFDARITAGCSATTYCPETNVTRGQMAAFLSRTGGRVDYDSPGLVSDLSTTKVLATVTIRAGNVPGGTAFIKLDASVRAYTNTVDETGCVPCDVLFQITRTNGGATSGFSTVSLHNITANRQELDEGSLTWVVAVPTGVDETFTLTGQRYFGSGHVNAYGSLAATYFPFGALGGDALGPSVVVVPSGSGPTPELPAR